ncbi:MAG: hypothetical protein ABSC61_02185 [Anaerolineales bacterium]
MRRVILSFDGFLRRQIGVFEFDDDPQGILRGQFSRTSYELAIAGRRIAAGSPVFFIHLWNEHIPAIPDAGPDLGWAARIYSRLIPSFRKLAGRLKTDSAYSGIEAIIGETVLVRDDAGFINKLFLRLGFSIIPYRNPLGRFGEFWENFYSWWIIWAYNQASLRSHHMFKLRRSQIIISREDFLHRYG